MGYERAFSLNYEDRIVWDMVRKSARPLHKSSEADEGGINADEEFAALFARPSAPEKQVEQPRFALKKAQALSIQALDRKTHRKIARGHTHIDARLDLHGLTQAEAYSLLLNFLQSAQYRNLKHVLVITGKGMSSGSDGILRQSVPHWLSTAPFRLYVNGYEDAARHHGGHGALYLRLRRTGG